MSVTYLLRSQLLHLKCPKTDFINTAHKHLNRVQNKIPYSNVRNNYNLCNKRVEYFSHITKKRSSTKSQCLTKTLLQSQRLRGVHTVGKISVFLKNRFPISPLKGLPLWNFVNVRHYNLLMDAWKKRAIAIVTGGGRWKFGNGAMGGLLAFTYAYFKAKQTPAPITGRKRIMAATPEQIQHYASIASFQVKTDFSTNWDNHPVFKPHEWRRPSLLANSHASHVKAQRILDTLINANPEAKNVENWELVVVDFDGITNGETFEDGTIFISKRMVDDLDDDELAFILGHEMAHAICNHYAESLSLGHYFYHTMANFALILMGKFNLDQKSMEEKLDWFHDLVDKRLMPAFTTHEVEADYIGLLFATRACYDRVAYRRMVHKWDTGVNKYPGGRFLTYKNQTLRDHQERMSDKTRFKDLPDWMKNYLDLRKTYWENEHPEWPERVILLDAFVNEMTAENAKHCS